MTSTCSWRVPLRLATWWFVLSRVLWLAYTGVLIVLGRVLWHADLAGSWWPLTILDRYDSGHFIRIAHQGYHPLSTGEDYFDVAFFPGFPGLARAVAWLLPGDHPSRTLVVACATVVSWLACWAAGVVLVRAAPLITNISLPQLAALWFVGPYAIFLFAPYSEALFACCAVATWYLARRERWGWAVVACAAAMATRVSGGFLIAMLGIMLLQAALRERTIRSWMRGALTFIPLIPVVAYFGWLYRMTGDPLHWLHTQSKGWGRQSTAPWTTAYRSVSEVFHGPAPFQMVFELIFWGLFVATFVWCWRRRAWELVVFVGLTLASLSQGPTLLSVPRNSLDCFPVYLALASWCSTAPRWAKTLMWCTIAVVFARNGYTLVNDIWTG
ncbi:MAG: hypothetical protein ACRCWS_03895 [Propionibacteriaceae bacterium]